MSANTLWINTGELSGDMRGAELARELRLRDPSLNFVGMGGVHLASEGVATPFRIEDLSVMGFTEVLSRLPRIISLLRGIVKTLAEVRPGALIVIDAPSFHFRVIKAARALGIPVYYYISPKIWAWREKRALFIRENVRRLISILPFEVEFYRRFGMEIDYVGNPLVDLLHADSLARVEENADLVGFLPGSRHKEVSSLLPQFGEAARILRQRLPQLEFCVMASPGHSEPYIRSFWPDDVPMTLVAPADRWRQMRGCRMLVAASGTVTLESALLGVPTLVAYKVSPLTFALGKHVVKIPYLSLANLILGREVLPELLQEKCDAVPLADKALSWLLPRPGTEPLGDVKRALASLKEKLGPPGAAGRAADVILKDLKSSG